MASLFKTEQGKTEILRLYDEKLASLNIAYESFVLPTKYGHTHLIKAGNPSKPPLIVIHGSNGCAPVGLETYRDLLNDFSVYAVDVLAQPNKSAETRLSMKDNSYGEWMNEIIDQLELKNVYLAGFSFGGLVILKTLQYNEENIEQVFLSAPAYIVNGNPIKALFRFFIPMKRFMKRKQPKHLHQFLDAAFTQKDEFAYNYLSQVFQHFIMDFTPVPVIKTKDAQRITAPITLFAAEDDIVFPGAKMIKRSKKIFPSLKHTTLLKESKHVQNSNDNARICQAIVESKCSTNE